MSEFFAQRSSVFKQLQRQDSNRERFDHETGVNPLRQQASESKRTCLRLADLAIC